jgi:uncharacterized protein
MRFISAGLLLLLSGCSSPPAITYYQLPAVVADNIATDTDVSAPHKALFVEPIQVASYLNGRGLVLQLSEVELVMARQHLWAEALESQLQRQLRDRLLSQAPEYTAVLQARADAVRISVQLEQFHGVAAGYAIASGRFAMSNQPDSHAFRLRVALADDGYPALVLALGQVLQQLSEQIAVQLQKPS